MACSPERAAIEALLPHRDPFLLVDRIADRGEDWIETEWHVAEDLDVFRGHYPGNPILPGVLISEHCFQSAALLLGNEPGTRGPDALLHALASDPSPVVREAAAWSLERAFGDDARVRTALARASG